MDAAYLPTTADKLMPAARAADLVIASQSDDAWFNSDMLDVPDRLATDSGRPVLIIPNKPRAPFSTKRILVAWNGRREATRAVFDAMPLLKGADEVKVIWIAPDTDSDAAGDLPGVALCAALSRHGIKVEQASIVAKFSAEETLLFEATKFGWDLLVMGCYGHSRLREFVLGGATRHVLANTTIPVLMSH